MKLDGHPCSNCGAGAMHGLTASRGLQVASPEDVSNFDMSNTEAAWACDDKWKRYISLGDFKNF